MNDRARARQEAAADWWRVTRGFVRPHCHANPALHRELRRRFRAHWPHLVRYTWGPFIEHARADGMDWHRHAGLAWARHVPALALEVAYIWAEDRSEAESRPALIRASAQQLRRLDGQIAQAVEHLRDLLRHRDAIQERTGVRTLWDRPGLSLWDAIEAASASFAPWAAVCRIERRDFLRVAREQSRPGPDLADVLEAVLGSEVSEPFASHGDDEASLNLPSGAGHGSPAEWVRRFMAEVERDFAHLDLPGSTGRCLAWFTNRGIADLLTVAAGRRPGDPPFTAVMVRDHRRRRLAED